MELIELCEKLNLPQEVIEGMAKTPAYLCMDEDEIIENLVNPDKYNLGFERLKGLSADPYGFYQLAVMLKASLITLTRYIDKGIDLSIFYDTMGCFRRYLDEHKQSFGFYAFDRGFFVGRHLSMTLFKIGSLDYEMLNQNGEKSIGVHIPTNTDLSPNKIDLSLSLQKDFFAKYYPEYSGVKYLCLSWLMSPSLQQLLPQNSNILQFQKRFELQTIDWQSQAYKQWVFKNANLSPEQFPENTSLQRKMKQFVLDGGLIGEGFAKLKI